MIRLESHKKAPFFSLELVNTLFIYIVLFLGSHTLLYLKFCKDPKSMLWYLCELLESKL